MEYDKEIFKVLTEAGSTGISVQKLSRHVYNAHNSLFTPIAFEDVHAYVSQFLLRNSKDPNSVVERTPVRGVYRLNTESQEGRELMLQFSEQHDDEPETPQNTSVDLSLSLFD
ncbi:MAG: hypothetical protein IKP16_05995 [Prevotella sp.]|nr:hypothetical protein [Prevotella sp.]